MTYDIGMLSVIHAKAGHAVKRNAIKTEYHNLLRSYFLYDFYLAVLPMYFSIIF